MHKHFTHYINLISILLAGLIGFYIFSYDPSFKIALVFALSASYIAWGIVHHTIHKDISLTVVLEYVTVSVLGLILVLSLLFRG